MVSPIAKYNSMGSVTWGHLKEQVYAAPPGTRIDLLSGFQAVVKQWTAKCHVFSRKRRMAHSCLP